MDLFTSYGTNSHPDMRLEKTKSALFNVVWLHDIMLSAMVWANKHLL